MIKDPEHFYPSYTFSDFVYKCDKRFFTPHSHKYVNKEDLLHLAAKAGDSNTIKSCLKAGVTVSHYFIRLLGENKHYDLFDKYIHRLPDGTELNSYTYSGGYIDRGLTSKVLEYSKSLSLNNLYSCIAAAIQCY